MNHSLYPYVSDHCFPSTFTIISADRLGPPPLHHPTNRVDPSESLQPFVTSSIHFVAAHVKHLTHYSHRHNSSCASDAGLATVASSNLFDQIINSFGNLSSLNAVFKPTPNPTWQDRAYDFLANRSAIESTSIALAAATFLFLIMSWSSRFSNLGRFSPFTRSPPQGSTIVSDADFSYITTEDLKRHQQQGGHAPEDLGPARDTDMLSLRNKGQSYPVHFPAYSMAKGELSVGQVREQAGRKIGVDARRVKLIFQGKNLKDDSKQCRQEGLKHESQILLTIGDIASASASDDEDGTDGVDDSADPDSAKRRRNRNKNKKRRNKPKTSGTSTPDASNLGVPLPHAQNSRAPSPKPPQSPLEKIASLREILYSWDKDVTAFENTPPAEPAKRDFEGKRLSETILTQVLLKTDAIETEGDPDARAKRKELVKETQDMLKRVDDAAVRHAS